MAQVRDLTHAHQIWNSLHDNFAQQSKAREMQLRLGLQERIVESEEKVTLEETKEETQRAKEGPSDEQTLPAIVIAPRAREGLSEVQTPPKDPKEGSFLQQGVGIRKKAPGIERKEKNHPSPNRRNPGLGEGSSRGDDPDSHNHT